MSTLSPGTVSHPFFESWDSCSRYDASNCGHTFGEPGQAGQIRVQSGPRIADTRNMIVKSFLTSFVDADALLMIDSDMAFESDALCKMLGWMYDGKATARTDKPAHPILGGLCFAGGKGHIYPTVYRALDFEETGHRFERWHDYPKDSLVQSAATGAAFLLVHRSVFEKMLADYSTLPGGEHNAHPWFNEGGMDGGKAIGEDIAFCIKAQASGFPIHIHTGIKTAHYKAVALDEEYYDALRNGTMAGLEVTP